MTGTVCLVLSAQSAPGPRRNGPLEADMGLFYSYVDSEDLGDNHGAGVRAGIKFFRLVHIDGRVSYTRYDNFDLDSIPLVATASVNLPIGFFNAYGGVGAGYYIFQDDDAVELDDEFGYFPFVGTQIDIGRNFALFGEVRWLELEPDLSGTTTDVDLSGYGVTAGILLRF